jgi:hypothetical protein
MVKPPFRKGIDPLIEAGLFEKASDPFGQFLWVCEILYLQKEGLEQGLRDAGIDPAVVLRRYPARPGSEGPHRKFFDKWYRRIAQDQLKRLTFLARKANPKNLDN